MMIACLTCLALWLSAEDGVMVKVDSGDFVRRGCSVSIPVPDSKGAWSIETEDGTPLPSQLVPGSPAEIHWRLPEEVPAHTTLHYRLRQGERPIANQGGIEIDDRDGALHLRDGDRMIIIFHHREVTPPPGIDPLYARSGYIHPLFSPGGQTVTADFPPSHHHQHGVWFAWTKTRFREHSIDFWNVAKGEGKVECLSYETVAQGAVIGRFRAAFQHLALLESKEVAVLNETWSVDVQARESAFTLDITSQQACATEDPLELLEYRYGGFGFRGCLQWEGTDKPRFLTDSSKGRLDGHGSDAHWCALFGPIDGQPVTVLLMGHPTNFRAPQPLRLHPSNPFFNFAPSQRGDFAITKEKPLRSRYRIVVAKGTLSEARLQEAWYDFAHPPLVERTAAEKGESAGY